MEYVAIAAIALSTVTSVAAARQRSASDEARLTAQAQADAYNAAVSKQRAESTRAVYSQREEEVRRRSRAALGKMRASLAQAGGGLGGSSADVLEQSEIAAELDALNVRYEGELAASGLLSEERLLTYQSGVHRDQAGRARRSGYLGQAGALLSGVGSYLNYSRLAD